MKYEVRESVLNDESGQTRNRETVTYDYLYDALQFAMFRMRRARMTHRRLSEWEHVPLIATDLVLSAFAFDANKDESIFIEVRTKD